MSKFIKKLLWSFFCVIVGILICKYLLTSKSIAIDDKDIPDKFEDAEAPPDATEPELKYFENTDKIVYLENQLRLIKEVNAQLENKKAIIEKVEETESEKDTSLLALNYQNSTKEFRWTTKPGSKELVVMKEPFFGKKYYAKVIVKSRSFLPLQSLGAKPDVNWKDYFDDFYMGQIEQQMSEGKYIGVIVGAAGLAAVLSGDKYIAAGGVCLVG
ncbi:MAG: hypothetical protein V3W20_11115, partial [Candidatus Neomarinimicrobiota bacterium]